MIYKHTRLITVLLFAVMIIVLAYLVMSVTSCSPTLTMTRPTPTVPTIIENGTIHHPYHVDYCPCGVPYDTWSVLTVNGHEKWRLNWLYDIEGGSSYALHPKDYILHNGQEYQISGLNRNALTMSVVPLGN
jgi:hypothetical protein